MEWLKYHFLPLVLYSMHFKEHGCVVVCSLDEIPGYFEGIENPHDVTIEMVFMTQAQYDKMPEFDGF